MSMLVCEAIAPQNCLRFKQIDLQRSFQNFFILKTFEAWSSTGVYVEASL